MTLSVFPLRTAEKLYLLLLVFHGSTQVVMYLSEGATFAVGFGVGVWVSLALFAVLVSAVCRSPLFDPPATDRECYP